MAEELELENSSLEEDAQVDEHVIDKRIKNLSEKVKLTSGERDELQRLNKEKDDKIVGLEKEKDFLNSFGDTVTKFPEAAQYKDKIKELVFKGYSIADAAVSTLVSEGKYVPPKKELETNMAAGGSAVTNPLSSEKPISELTRDEKRARLVEAEARGEISIE